MTDKEHIKRLEAGWDEAANEIYELRRQVARLEAEKDAVAAALEGLKHRGGCWCEVAIDNPMLAGRHTQRCRDAFSAFNRVKPFLAARDARMKAEGLLAAVRYLREHGERIETGEITVLEAAREIERMGEEVERG